MVDPVVLEAVGYDPEKYSGFAAGFGVERFAMIMHNIQDIRLFWENHPEFLSQFPSIPYAAPGDRKEVEERESKLSIEYVSDEEFQQIYTRLQDEQKEE